MQAARNMLKKNTDIRKPNHVAIIMDGNGRWALARNRRRIIGHYVGAKRVREIVKCCPDLGVKHLTIFAFSTENWKRTQSEVAGLMRLFKRYINHESHCFKDYNVRVRFIGDRIKLDNHLVDLMDELELLTSSNNGLNLTIAINYGGRDEVARATKRLAKDLAVGKIDAREINEETLPKYLDTYFLPDPDLVIRTSGEARISNFLLWQSAYSEYEFVDTLWPDFTSEIFEQVLTSYLSRSRRFGGVPA